VLIESRGLARAPCDAIVVPASAMLRLVPAPSASLSGSYQKLAGSPAVIRGRMASALPLLATRRDATSRAIARALASTALGRLPAEEREWVARIEDRRRLLAARQGDTRADFGPQPDGLPEWAVPFERPIPTWGATALLSIPPDWGLLLMRLVRELRPRSCLELGTGFGMSTAYQAAALELNRAGSIVTLDAAREWSAIAQEQLAALGLGHRVEQRVGQIAETLDRALQDAAPVDYAFVDAEHVADPTREYFERLVGGLSRPIVIVFDDIGFPRQMRFAWKAIKEHDRTALAIGLTRLGIVVAAP